MTIQPASLNDQSMKTASELVTAFDATPRDIENWISRLDNLTTKFQETTQGKSRLYSKANALELAFIAGVVRGGATPREGAIYAATLLRKLKYGGFKQWLVFPAGNLKTAISSDNPTLDSMVAEFGSTTLTFVATGEIVRRVNALFEEG